MKSANTSHNEMAISVRNLTKQYKTTLAVNDISFDIRAGGITALLGGNGAGKTTTIAMLLGVLTPTSGTLNVLGHDMLTDRFKALQKMNFSSPYVDLPKKLTVRQMLKVYGRLYNVKNLDAESERLAKELDVFGFYDRQLGKLSAGQQTRVSLAKSLINSPELLLLDEPTASLDPDTADHIRMYLKSYCRKNKATVLLASHNMREVEKIGDHVLMMKKGRVVDQDTPQGLIARYGRQDLEEVFLDIARADTVLAEENPRIHLVEKEEAV